MLYSAEFVLNWKKIQCWSCGWSESQNDSNKTKKQEIKKKNREQEKKFYRNCLF